MLQVLGGGWSTESGLCRPPRTASLPSLVVSVSHALNDCFLDAAVTVGLSSHDPPPGLHQPRPACLSAGPSIALSTGHDSGLGGAADRVAGNVAVGARRRAPRLPSEPRIIVPLHLIRDDSRLPLYHSPHRSAPLAAATTAEQPPRPHPQAPPLAQLPRPTADGGRHTRLRSERAPSPPQTEAFSGNPGDLSRWRPIGSMLGSAPLLTRAGGEAEQVAAAAAVAEAEAAVRVEPLDEYAEWPLVPLPPPPSVAGELVRRGEDGEGGWGWWREAKGRQEAASAATLQVLSTYEPYEERRGKEEAAARAVCLALERLLEVIVAEGGEEPAPDAIGRNRLERQQQQRLAGQVATLMDPAIVMRRPPKPAAAPAAAAVAAPKVRPLLGPHLEVPSSTPSVAIGGHLRQLGEPPCAASPPSCRQAAASPRREPAAVDWPHSAEQPARAQVEPPGHLRGGDLSHSRSVPTLARRRSSTHAGSTASESAPAVHAPAAWSLFFGGRHSRKKVARTRPNVQAQAGLGSSAGLS